MSMRRLRTCIPSLCRGIQSIYQERNVTKSIIFYHVVALFVFGFLNIWQWIASLLAFVAGGAILIQFNKCAYITAAILYPLGIIADIMAAFTWYEDNDERALAVFPAIGAGHLLAGAVLVFKTIYKWDQSEAPERTPPVQAESNVSHPAPSYPVVTAHQQSTQAPEAYVDPRDLPLEHNGTTV